jgi:hypothetical protein
MPNRHSHSKGTRNGEACVAPRCVRHPYHTGYGCTSFLCKRHENAQHPTFGERLGPRHVGCRMRTRLVRRERCPTRDAPVTRKRVAGVNRKAIQG